jgi:hypothetical protein
VWGASIARFNGRGGHCGKRRSIRCCDGSWAITIRPFAWHDLITLYRFRRRVLCTESARVLTHGSPLGPLAMLTHLDPTRGIFTGVCPARHGRPALVGQVTYLPGERSAHISFLLPDDALDPAALGDLLEALAEMAGSWGAFNLLVEVEEYHSALDSIRRSGFGVYAWQTIWQVRPPADASGEAWQPTNPVDDPSVRSLYQQLVPPLVQSAEPFPANGATRLVYRQEGDLLAYADATFGPHGIYLQPVVHPAVENPAAILASLIARQPAIPARPIYVAVRSYQAWIEPTLQRLDGAVTPRHALLVKHLAVAQRANLLARPTSRELYTTDSAVPLVQHSTIHDN